MKRNRFSVEQIISILKEYEAGARMVDLSCKSMGSASRVSITGSRSMGDERKRGKVLKAAGGRERQVEAPAGGDEVRQQGIEGVGIKKVVTPGGALPERATHGATSV